MFSPLSTSHGHCDRGPCFGLALALIWASARESSAFRVKSCEVEAVLQQFQELEL